MFRLLKAEIKFNNKKIMIQEVKKFNIQAKITNQFLAEVEFGMPSKDCNNFGICRIHLMNQNAPLALRCCKSATAVITINNRNQVQFHFLRKTICASTYAKIFAGLSFLVLEEYNSINLEGIEINILPGEYPIINQDAFIQVNFNGLMNN